MNDPQIESAGNMLIVDDMPANLRLLSDMLKKHGYRVRPAPSGELALQAAQIDPPDLVLLDISMPEMDGYEVCQRFKADPRLRDIPIIFVSALDEVLDKVKAFGSGGVDYITKPVHYEEVKARVRTHLELRRREQLLHESYTRLQGLERLRDNLVHMVVHDMRSQLTVMTAGLGLVEMLDAAGRTPANKVWRNMTHAAERLKDMITQLLDISRLEAGQMPLHKTACNLAQTAQEALEAAAPLADPRQLAIHAPEPVWAECDLDLVRRVLANLLANAIKFTPASGEVRIEVGGEGRLARVAVADTGQGIPPEFHQKVFEKFGQAEVAHKGLGTGLGLAFCKLAVEAQGGEIGLVSAPGQGSTFWFSLPAADPPQG
jgi:signal transduction histidine kinase